MGLVHLLQVCVFPGLENKQKKGHKPAKKRHPCAKLHRLSANVPCLLRRCTFEEEEENDPVAALGSATGDRAGTTL